MRNETLQKISLILSKTLDIYKKPWFYLLFIKLLFLQKPLFDKGFWLHQEFSTKLKKKFAAKNTTDDKIIFRTIFDVLNTLFTVVYIILRFLIKLSN